ncbi:MAG: hypothetical protein ACP5QK_08875 [Myxococcota bacterium]
MKGFIIFIFVFFISDSISAQQITGSKAFSMSDAFSAVASTNDALFINAAGISLYPNRYNIDLLHQYKNDGGFNISTISILDSTTFPLGAEFAFSYMWGEDYGVDKKGYRLDLGFSYPFATRLLWGFDVKYVRLDIASKENAINAATADTGFLFLVNKWFRVSLYGQNLIYVGRDELPTKSGAGTMIGTESSFYAAEDTVFSFYRNGERKITQSVGANLFLSGMFSLSAGYKYDQTQKNNHFISAGTGLFSKAAGVEISYRLAIEEKGDFQLLGSIKFFME